MGAILGNLVGGVGLFFVGLHMITEGLGQSAGRRLRLLFSRWTNTGIGAGLVGLLAGFIAQSTSAVSFILASLVTAGMTNARRALPVILWASSCCAPALLHACKNQSNTEVCCGAAEFWVGR